MVEYVYRKAGGVDNFKSALRIAVGFVALMQTDAVRAAVSARLDKSAAAQTSSRPVFYRATSQTRRSTTGHET